MLVIRKTEAGEKHAYVCSSLGLAPATVTFFWTTAWAFFSKIERDLIDIFFSIICVTVYTPNSLN